MAGLGVDEVLYRAKVHPARLGQRLTREAKAIRKETITVLAQAVKRVAPPFAPTAMLLVRMAPCRKNTRSMGNRPAFTCAAGHRSRNPAGGREPTFAPIVKGELDGKNHWIQEGLLQEKVHCHPYLRERIMVHDLQAPGGRTLPCLSGSFGRDPPKKESWIMSSADLSDPSERDWSNRIQGRLIREALAKVRDRQAAQSDLFMDIFLIEQGYEGWFESVWLVAVTSSSA